ncbi:2'-5' RNA ligase family protein [Mycobacterium sp. ITM-2016-00317]|uniref:2'-5' RNA ligase family protein n=1 Tax=Mycobacterium sp. ITM-2016-00317 TaxID=2099694 RepID=UPI000D4B8771|nr:2'-5' RNA ligase family protein [Mycobacterium sp. ITM-2016-00317]WNG89967.1 2'-5' RNA ligase family protein [Mycobacterium sp. ITM-2016-00317]
MVHSVELLFDAATESAVRHMWEELSEAGIRSMAGHRSPTNRPHVTLTVAEELDGAVDDALAEVLGRLPLPGVLGAPMLFGAGRAVTLVRLLVPSRELLSLQADVHRICLPHMPKGALPHADPGGWTPHVTLARRVPVDQLPAVFTLRAVTRDLPVTAVGLRHWDGDERVEHAITPAG